MLRTLLTSLALLASTPVSAQDLRPVDSWDHGTWRVATMVNAGTGLRLCAAETTSVFDQVFSLVFYENDDAFLEIRDVSWDYVNGDPLRFLLIVDRDEAVVTGQGWDGSMSWDLIEPDSRGRLLARLSRGSRLDVRMPNRSRVAQFPLDGAEAAIDAVQSCWAAIRAGGDYQP